MLKKNVTHTLLLLISILFFKQIDSGIKKIIHLKSPDKKQDVFFYHHQHYIDPETKEKEDKENFKHQIKKLAEKQKVTVLIENYPDNIVEKMLKMAKFMKEIDKKLFPLIDIKIDTLKYYNKNIANLYNDIKEVANENENITIHAIDTRGPILLRIRFFEFLTKCYLLSFLSKNHEEFIKEKKEALIREFGDFTWEKCNEFIEKEKNDIKKLITIKHKDFIKKEILKTIYESYIKKLEDFQQKVKESFSRSLNKPWNELLTASVKHFGSTWGENKLFALTSAYILKFYDQRNNKEILKSLSKKLKDFQNYKHEVITVLENYTLGPIFPRLVFGIFPAIKFLIDSQIIKYVTQEAHLNEVLFIWAGNAHCSRIANALTGQFIGYKKQHSN